MNDLLKNSYNEIKEDENGRYRSWEHCYSFFTTNRHNSNIDIEYYCLHLFVYLASWGMLRGSSFLLQKDYLVHKEVVVEILDRKYDILVGLDPEMLDDFTISLIIDNLKKKIIDIYYHKTYVLNSKIGDNKTASDTLITKILLGTLGCVPAYDRYFIEGMRIMNIKNRSFNKKSLMSLKEFYLFNKHDIQKSYEIINDESNVNYPIMKLIDMYFWQLGMEKDK